MYRIFCIQVLFLLVSLDINAQGKEKKHNIFRDSLDNAYDISNWLINKKGVLIVPTVITEPAVGYGAAAAALYFHSSYTEKNGPPSITGVMGGGTENGTWFAGILHAGFRNNSRIDVPDSQKAWNTQGIVFRIQQ